MSPRWNSAASAWRLRLFAIVSFAFSVDAYATEYQLSEDAAPESVDEIDRSLGELTGEFVRDPRVIFRPIDRWRRTRGPFIRDGQLKYDFRTYYYEADRGDLEPAAWAAGGKLVYRSGLWRETVAIGASWYNSFKLSGGSDANETLLVRSSDGANLSAFGEAYLELNWKGMRGRFYRQELNLPYINRFDNRMLPNSFEAYGVGREGSSLDFVVAQVEKIKRRGDNSFISMGEAAGAEGDDSGVTLAGFNWSPGSGNFQLGGINQWTKDIFNTFYTEAVWSREFTERAGLRFSGQYTDQRSSGDELLGDFDTYTWGTQLAANYNYALLTLAFTQTDDGAAIRSPYGGRPSYLSMMIRDFDRANEKAWRAGLSYHFDLLGVPDLSFLVNVVKGRQAVDVLTGQELPDQSEYDYTLDYKPTKGPLEGFWFRARYAEVREDGFGKVVDELRLIVNYSLPIF